MEQRFHIPLLLGLCHHIIHILPHTGEGGEIGLHIRLGLRHRHADVLTEGKGGDAVDDTEVHGFRPAAHLVGHIAGGHMEHLGRRGSVDVRAGGERRLHGRVPGDVGQQPQFNLGVVRIHQNAALCRNEHPANFAAKVRPGGDILQIRLRGAEPPGGGNGHLEPGADAPIRVQGLQKALSVGGLQLGVLSVFQHRPHDGGLIAQLFQHVGIGGPAGFRFLAVGQAQPAK